MFSSIILESCYSKGEKKLSQVTTVLLLSVHSLVMIVYKELARKSSRFLPDMAVESDMEKTLKIEIARVIVLEYLSTTTR